MTPGRVRSRSPEEVLRTRPLRAHGYSARQIAKVLDLPRVIAAAFVRQPALAGARALAAGEVRACWVSAGWSAGLLVDERFRWPERSDAVTDTPGLAAVLVARSAGRDTVSACGYLVDLYCRGVKDVIGPRVLNDQQHAQFTRTFFAGYRQPPIAAPIELAQQLVLGSARFARALGFEAAPGFDAVRGHLGDWSGIRAITFGRHARPEYIQGPYDDAAQEPCTLRRDASDQLAEGTATQTVAPIPGRPVPGESSPTAATQRPTPSGAGRTELVGV